MPECRLLLPEGHAVGALVLGGVFLVGTDLDAVQGAVVFTLAVVGTLMDGTFDRLVGMAVHKKSSFEFEFRTSTGLQYKMRRPIVTFFCTTICNFQQIIDVTY